MSALEVHTIETAPDGSTEILGDAKKATGFVPNLYGVFAESPALLKAYTTISGIFDETSFTPIERQVVLLAVSRFNECAYCMAAHSVIAGMQKVPSDVIDALRQDKPIGDERLEALRRFTTTMVEKRGWAPEQDVADFLGAGYTQQQVLEVILGVSMKTMSNYVNHLAETPLDDAFASMAWR